MRPSTPRSHKTTNRVTARPRPTSPRVTLGSPTILCFIEIHWGSRETREKRGGGQNCGDACCRRLIFVSESFAPHDLASSYRNCFIYVGVSRSLRERREKKISSHVHSSRLRLLRRRGHTAVVDIRCSRTEKSVAPTNIFSRCPHCCTRT